MKFGTILMLLGVVAIPTWYGYRTFNEKRVRHLEWNEVFMTESARQQKWAEEKKQAQEKEDAERAEAAAELEKKKAAERATKETDERRRQDEAKAQAIASEKRRAESAEAERKVTEQIASRVKAEKTAANERHEISTKAQVCASHAKEATLVLHNLAEARAAYETYTDKILQESFPKGGTITEEEFAKTFKQFHLELSPENPRKLERALENCNATAESWNHSDENDRSFQSAVDSLDELAESYRRDIDYLKTSQTEIGELADYAASRIPNTLGGQVIRSRMIQAVKDARYK